jgi:hypothetical protein
VAESNEHEIIRHTPHLLKVDRGILQYLFRIAFVSWPFLEPLLLLLICCEPKTHICRNYFNLANI